MTTELAGLGWGALGHQEHSRHSSGKYEVDHAALYPPVPADVLASSSTEEPVAAAYSSMTSADSGALPGYEQQAAVNLPPEVIRAFLQQQQHQPSDPGDNFSEADAPSTSAVTPAPYGPSSTVSPEPHTHSKQPQQQPPRTKKRSLWRRILKGLLLTSGGLALVGGGVLAGVAMYKNYMESLDDRAQLASRVEQLKKAEDKLHARCAAMEVERDKLQKKIADAAAAAVAADQANSSLSMQLAAASSERDEALRYNLNWQRKFNELEASYEAAAAERGEALQAADKLRSENGKLAKEVKKLLGSLESLEGKYGQLEATVLQLKARV